MLLLHKIDCFANRRHQPPVNNSSVSRGLKIALFLTPLLVAACAPVYQYTPANDADPTLFFAEKFTQDRMIQPNFFVAVWDKNAEPQCADIIRIGLNTKSVRVPAGKMIGVTALDGQGKDPGFIYSCSPPGRLFVAEANTSYSVDIETIWEARRVSKCRLALMHRGNGRELSLTEAPLLVCKQKVKN